MRQLVYSIYLSAILIAAIPVIAGATGVGHVIFDNTANDNGSPGIITNMDTKYDPRCTKNDSVQKNTCNSFAVDPGAIQVMQRSTNNTLVAQVGVDNSANSYGNAGDQSTRLHYFDGDNLLFDLQRFRDAAEWISHKTPSGTTPGTYGSITWEQFIDNVANHRTMYGIVRVKVPMVEKGSGKNTFHKQKPKIYGFCGKKNGNSNSNSNSNNTDTCNRCGPEANGQTVLESGKTICDTKLPDTAAIDVRGSLMFDFVDCITDDVISPENLPESVQALSFQVAVPVNINPANVNTQDLTMQTIDGVAGLSITKSCGTSPCSISITDDIPFTLVPAQSKQAYEYRNGAPLNETEFATLSEADKYHLLMPSGYAQGWLDAFNQLGITNDEWKQQGFRTARDTGPITLDDIRSDDFEDIPAYMYTGGLVDMHYHINISGLVYVPQAIELEQKGVTFSVPDIAPGDTKTNPQNCPKKNVHVPAKQYIMGAVIVRDGFYLGAEDNGGVTLISNDPDSYSEVTVANYGIASDFQAYDRSSATGNNAASLVAAEPGPQWVEIRAR